MSTLVGELIDAAVDPSISACDLLRRALIVARRLALPNLADWISKELNGYCLDDVPTYRHVSGQLMAEHPIQGPIPLIPPSDIAELFEVVPLRQSLSELVELVQNAPTGTSPYTLFGVDTERIIMKMMQECNGVMYRPLMMLSTITIQGVVNKVRLRILDWALDLESGGILGEGMTFTQQEKQAMEQHYHFGDITGSQIQIGTSKSSQNHNQTSGDIEALSAVIQLIGDAIQQGTIEAEIRDELKAELTTLQAQATSPKPKWTVIKVTAASIKQILENAAGGMLAIEALPYLAALL